VFFVSVLERNKSNKIQKKKRTTGEDEGEGEGGGVGRMNEEKGM
jgi:hypothetical protein